MDCRAVMVAPFGVCREPATCAIVVVGDDDHRCEVAVCDAHRDLAWIEGCLDYWVGAATRIDPITGETRRFDTASARPP